MPYEGRGLLSLRPLLLLLLITMLIGATVRTAEAQVESRKSPWVALGLSMLPGGGQAYNGQWAKGGLMLGGAVLFSVPLLGQIECGLDPDDECGGAALIVGFIGIAGIALWTLIDAPISAIAINRRIDEGQVALEIGPQLMVRQSRSAMGDLRPSGFPSSHRDLRIDVSLVGVRF